MYGMAVNDLGIRIKRARERKRWSQQQLAAALGVGARSVGRWERGEAEPRNSIGALEAVLGVDLTSGEPPDPNEEALMALDLDPAERRKLIEAYRAIRDGERTRRAG
jgi:transcriptional regulator with XRE-family HTH domain